MKKLMLFAVAAAVLGGCTSLDRTEPNDAIATATSPDGRNEIRLWWKPLRYEVRRDGVVVVAKSEIGMKVNGQCLCPNETWNGGGFWSGAGARSGKELTPVYKKSEIDLSANEAFVDFGDWRVRLAARNDGVAYRFETEKAGEITVDCEKAEVVIPDAKAKCWANRTGGFGQEESRPVSTTVGELKTVDGGKGDWAGKKMIYLPFAYSVGGKYVAVTESDVRDYPVWNLARGDAGREGAPRTGEVSDGAAKFGSRFEGAPKKTQRVGGWGSEKLEKGGRWVKITEHEDWLVKTAGTRTFPWRTFVLADRPVKFCEADIVRALAPKADDKSDFSWVKPGKVAWDWWNCFDNLGDPEGCTTKTYERFIDFAAKNGVEYVIFDEGWSEKLNIWKYSPAVDVPHLIDYANRKGVGIILWMAWAQVYGEEEKVASHFAKLGAKGFKVDFMDRGDAECANFLEKFAAACAKHKMLVDYHGAYRPNGLQRRYPNVINYEGIHGLEQMKWFKGGADEEEGMMFNDVAAFYLRLTAGPMDYTPGAMLNHAIGTGFVSKGSKTPGSIGTRCRQMAMMALYEAPLQMLCDSPTNYEKNMECFRFMAAVPTTWQQTVGLAGCPDTMVAAARQAKDGSWYAAGMTTVKARDFTLDTAFLGEGTWKAEIFRDGADADKNGASYVHETTSVKAGRKLDFRMAAGGGFVVRFSK